MSKQQVSSVYVVTYQAYQYGTEIAAEAEMKDLLEKNWSVKGVFKTEDAAKKYIDEEIVKISLEMYGDKESLNEIDKKYAKNFEEEERNSHSVECFKVGG